MRGGKKKGINRGSKIILMLAVIIAGLVGFGFYQYANTMKTTVYLYNDYYPQGTRIAKEMFASTMMDTSTCNALAGTGNRYATADDVVQAIEKGECLLVDTAKYTVASMNQFVTAGGTPIESRLAKNMVSVELPADKVTGLSAGVRIGSHLNVVTGYSIDSSKNADLIFQDLLVVDVVQNADGKRAVYVEVEPTESVQLIHSVMFESTAVTILKPGSYIAVNGNQATYKRDYSSESSGAAFLNNLSGDIPIQQNSGVTLGQEVQN